ncbi:DSPTP1 [Symbiodinium microadriaticum]|nr:DSPTP1 [Symbiodinium microadriaticum]
MVRIEGPQSTPGTGSEHTSLDDRREDAELQAALRQVSLDGSSACQEFKPNPRLAHLCTECFKSLNHHAASSITSAKHIAAAVETSSAGKKAATRVLEISGGAAIYLGGVGAVMNSAFLEKENICGVVTCARDLHVLWPKFSQAVADAEARGVRFHLVPLLDEPQQKLEIAELRCATKFLDQIVAEGGNALVHCAQGRSRSTTVLLAYMATQNMTVDSALASVQDKRQMAQPNSGFLEQLRKFERRGELAEMLDPTPQEQNVICPGDRLAQMSQFSRAPAMWLCAGWQPKAHLEDDLRSEVSAAADSEGQRAGSASFASAAAAAAARADDSDSQVSSMKPFKFGDSKNVSGATAVRRQSLLESALPAPRHVANMAWGPGRTLLRKALSPDS